MRKSDFVHCSIKTYTYFKVYNAISGALVILRGPFVTSMTPCILDADIRKEELIFRYAIGAFLSFNVEFGWQKLVLHVFAPYKPLYSLIW